jgi:hypothetical protein
MIDTEPLSNHKKSRVLHEWTTQWHRPNSIPMKITPNGPTVMMLQNMLAMHPSNYCYVIPDHLSMNPIPQQKGEATYNPETHVLHQFEQIELIDKT